MKEKPIHLYTVLRQTHGSLAGTFVQVVGVATGERLTNEDNGPIAVYFRRYAAKEDECMALHLLPSWFVHEDGSPIEPTITLGGTLQTNA